MSERQCIDMPCFINTVRAHFQDNKINTIVEVGALDAADAVYFKECYPNAHVIAIEGLPGNYNKYMKNLNDITTINCIIFDYDGEIDYHKKNINGIHGVFDRGQIYGTKKLKKQKCKRLDSLMKEIGVTSIDMMKIDVEGATYEILKSMGTFLNNVKVMHIETETYPFFKGQKLYKDVFDLLEEYGFTCADFTECVITKHGKQQDSVWIKNNDT